MSDRQGNMKNSRHEGTSTGPEVTNLMQGTKRRERRGFCRSGATQKRRGEGGKALEETGQRGNPTVASESEKNICIALEREEE